MGDPGFSLLEALVATALAGTMALGVVTMMAFSVSAAGVSEEITALTAVAIDQLETLNALAFRSDELRPGGSLVRSAAGYSLDEVDGDPNVYMRWEVQDVSANLKRIRLIAAYRSSTMGQREIDVETYRVLSQ